MLIRKFEKKKKTYLSLVGLELGLLFCFVGCNLGSSVGLSGLQALCAVGTSVLNNFMSFSLGLNRMMLDNMITDLLIKGEIE